MNREDSYTLTTKPEDENLLRLLRHSVAAGTIGAFGVGNETAQVAG